MELWCFPEAGRALERCQPRGPARRRPRSPLPSPLRGTVRRQLRTLLLLFLCKICTNAALRETGPCFPPQTTSRRDGVVDAKAWLCSALRGAGWCRGDGVKPWATAGSTQCTRAPRSPLRRHSESWFWHRPLFPLAFSAFL